MIELADIFRQHGQQYRKKFGDRIPLSHLRAMRDIQRCRTEALGGQTYRCPDCEHVLYSYHSCRNRHCPKCQNENAQRWLDNQQHNLLPVPYFLLTFTLPDELGKVARSHQHLIYNLLFRISAAATQQLVYVLKAFGHNLMETLCLSDRIIHLHFVDAAGDVKSGFAL